MDIGFVKSEDNPSTVPKTAPTMYYQPYLCLLYAYYLPQYLDFCPCKALLYKDLQTSRTD